eukprot:TRINITY_DN13666_c0_g1_i1.p1 TRINITY_DN13666_c0_g1~~TRINITY_DN13666_c0_g1_i1.p1  ORF type:complete len:298 (+),score=97.12 TRINITY_DN13666_c0_g1_i1:105-998(+)
MAVAGSLRPKAVDPKTVGSSNGLRQRAAKEAGDELADSEAHFCYEELQAALRDPNKRAQVLQKAKENPGWKERDDETDSTGSTGSTDSFFARLFRGCARRNKETILSNQVGAANAYNAEDEASLPPLLRMSTTSSYTARAGLNGKKGDMSEKTIIEAAAKKEAQSEQSSSTSMSDARVVVLATKKADPIPPEDDPSLPSVLSLKPKVPEEQAKKGASNFRQKVHASFSAKNSKEAYLAKKDAEAIDEFKKKYKPVEADTKMLDPMADEAYLKLQEALRARARDAETPKPAHVEVSLS